MIINGKKIAEGIYESIKRDIKEKNLDITLGAILVGNNASSLRYIEQKRKWADYVGIKFVLKQLDEEISEENLLNTIKHFNENDKITGYIMQLPLPKKINSKKIIDAIDPKKDVDGFHSNNVGKMLIGDDSGLVPCTPAGIMEIFKYLNIDLEGKVVSIIGRSNIVGKPMNALLINAGATVITCNSKTKDIKGFTSKSDIVIIAVGKPGFLKINMVNSKAIIIDVGFTVVEGKIHGDADEHFKHMTNRITPVPGGVGALTVAMLMKNTLKIKSSPSLS